MSLASSKNRYMVVAASISLVLFIAHADEPRVLRSGPARVSVLELYTSEGCSSCPPAEKWLGALKSSPELWVSVVPVVFHVDYWDRLGWPDPFASETHTARQYLYAQRWAAANVYTPEFVLNGKEWRRTKKTSFTSAEAAGVLEVKIAENEKFEIRYKPAEESGKTWHASVAYLAFGAVTSVKAGENRGRDLEHNFSVIGYRQSPLKIEGDSFTAVLALNQSVKVPMRQRGVAIWVSSDGITPEQAVGGYLD